MVYADALSWVKVPFSKNVHTVLDRGVASSGCRPGFLLGKLAGCAQGRMDEP
jgi:hypothetical protein